MSIFKQLENSNLSPEDLKNISSAVNYKMSMIFVDSLESLKDLTFAVGKTLKSTSIDENKLTNMLLQAITGKNIDDVLNNISNDDSKDADLVLLNSKFEKMKDISEEIFEKFMSNIKYSDGNYVKDDKNLSNVNSDLIDFKSVINCYDINSDLYLKLFDLSLDISEGIKDFMIKKIKSFSSDDIEEKIKELTEKHQEFMDSISNYRNFFTKTKNKLENFQKIKSKLDLINEIID